MLYTLFKFFNDQKINYNNKILILNDIDYLYNELITHQNYENIDILFEYPYNFNIMSDKDLNNFNQLYIRQEVFDTLDKLLIRIQNNNINILFNQIKNIPQSNYDMKLDFIRYKFIDTKITNIFNFSKIYNSEKSFKNYIFDIIKYNNKKDNSKSFIVYYLINTILTKYIDTRLTYPNLLHIEVIENQKLYNHLSFNSISDLFNTTELVQNLLKLILQNVYTFTTISPLLINKLDIYFTETQLNLLTNKLNIFFQTNNYNFIVRLLTNLVNLTNDQLTNNITESFYLVRNSFLSFNNNEKSIKQYENKIINDYILLSNDTTFQIHKYILYYYRYDFVKFINILPLVCEDYINTQVKGNNEYSISPQQFKLLLNNINLNLSDTFLDFLNIINPLYDNNYIVYDVILNNDSQILDLAIKLTYLEYIESFITTIEFNDVIEKILYNIYTYLKNNTYINYNENWLLNKSKIINFIHLWLKKEVIREDFNIDLKLSLIDSIEQIKSHPFQHIDNDTNLQYFNNIIENIYKFDYKQMHMFFENMISTTITKSLYDDILNKYKI